MNSKFSEQLKNYENKDVISKIEFIKLLGIFKEDFMNCYVGVANNLQEYVKKIVNDNEDSSKDLMVIGLTLQDMYSKLNSLHDLENKIKKE